MQLPLSGAGLGKVIVVLALGEAMGAIRLAQLKSGAASHRIHFIELEEGLDTATAAAAAAAAATGIDLRSKKRRSLLPVGGDKVNVLIVSTPEQHRALTSCDWISDGRVFAVIDCGLSDVDFKKEREEEEAAAGGGGISSIISSNNSSNNSRSCFGLRSRFALSAEAEEKRVLFLPRESAPHVYRFNLLPHPSERPVSTVELPEAVFDVNFRGGGGGGGGKRKTKAGAGIGAKGEGGRGGGMFSSSGEDGSDNGNEKGSAVADCDDTATAASASAAAAASAAADDDDAAAADDDDDADDA